VILKYVFNLPSCFLRRVGSMRPASRSYLIFTAHNAEGVVTLYPAFGWRETQICVHFRKHTRRDDDRILEEHLRAQSPKEELHGLPAECVPVLVSRFSISASASRMLFPVSTDVESDSCGIYVVSPHSQSLHRSVYFGVYFSKRKENKLNNLKSPFSPHSP